jgi:hypothetical protein
LSILHHSDSFEPPASVGISDPHALLSNERFIEAIGLLGIKALYSGSCELWRTLRA